MAPLLFETSIAGALGLLSHWGVFIHGEQDTHAAAISRAFLGGICLTYLVQWRIFEEAPLAAAAQTAIIDLAYFIMLVASIVFYRLFLSPLKNIPGPLPLKVTKTYHTWSIRKADNFRFAHKLHKQYGDVVRSGPNEVTLFTTEAFYALYGPDSSCIRSVYYDSLLPLDSLLNTRNDDTHAKWRRVWDQGFSMKALGILEPKVYTKGQQLIGRLEQRLGKKLNIADWFEAYTFDLMGIAGFDLDFNLTGGEKHRSVDLYNEGHKILGPVTPAPWLLHLASGVPGTRKAFLEFRDWAGDVLRNMTEKKSEHKAVLNWLIDDAKANGGLDSDENWRHLLGEAILFITAGSDPMHQNLTNIMYYLAKEPRHVKQIREELATLKDIEDYKALQQLTHLNAVIYETLRLNPPVPCAGLRVTPPGGLEINGTHIPGGTTVVVPQYSLYRRSDCFEKPEEFIPERFSTKPDMIKDKRTWMPWSTGRYTCIGKNFGLMEIRVAVALMVNSFEIALAPGEDGQAMFQETLDLFTCVPGPLNVVLTERKG